MINDTASSPRPAAPGDTDKVLGLVNYALLFFAHWLGFIPAIIAVILAYVRRSDADAIGRTHYDFQIRTFWIGFILGVIGIVLGVMAVFSGLGASFSAAGDFVGAAWSLGGVTVLLAIGCGLAFAASFFWTLVASAYGFFKQVSGSPIGGRSPAPLAA